MAGRPSIFGVLAMPGANPNESVPRALPSATMAWRFQRDDFHMLISVGISDGAAAAGGPARGVDSTNQQRLLQTPIEFGIDHFTGL
ncbi:MAG: hypothetical protein ABSE16_10110 [Verrucomicrobiota bacterium]|jgi:hypothetical protein